MIRIFNQNEQTIFFILKFQLCLMLQLIKTKIFPQTGEFSKLL